VPSGEPVWVGRAEEEASDREHDALVLLRHGRSPHRFTLGASALWRLCKEYARSQLARRRVKLTGGACPQPLDRHVPVAGETMSDPVDRPSQRSKPKPEVTQIGGRQLKPSTLMMGYGYDPVLSEGSLKPPIFLTSTFVFESAEAGKRHFEGITGKRAGGAEGLVYSRFN